MFPSVPAVPSSAFKGFRFPSEIVVLAIRWYLRYGLSYRDVEELLAERGIEVDHVTSTGGSSAHSTAPRAHGEPVEVVTDRAPALRAAIGGLMPAAFHNTEPYENNRVECDHGRLKARLRPMRGLKRDRTARVIIRGHALMLAGHGERRPWRSSGCESAGAVGPVIRLCGRAR